MKVLIASSSLVAEPSLRALLSSSHEVIGGLTTPDTQRGRGREISENGFAQLLKREKLPVYKPLSSSELINLLESARPDVVITISYGKLIKSDALKVPKFGWINVHFKASTFGLPYPAKCKCFTQPFVSFVFNAPLAK